MTFFSSGNRSNDFLSADLKLQAVLKKWSGYLMLTVLVISLLVLGGWQFAYLRLLKEMHEWVAMNPLVATCFFGYAIAFFLLVSPRSSRIKTWLGQAISWLILLAGLLKILENLSLLAFRVDTLVFSTKVWLGRNDHSYEKMAVSSSYCLVLSSLSLIWLNGQSAWKKIFSQCLAILVALIAFFALIGYLYKVRDFYGVFGYVPMAMFTASCFLMMSVAFILEEPRVGIMRTFTGDLTGSINLRAMIPVAVFVPVVLGLLRLFGYWGGLFSPEFGVAILVLGIVIVLLAIIWYNAGLLNNRDIKRLEAERTLRESEARFRLTLKSIKDYAICTIDPRGYIMSWNEGAESVNGYTSQEVIGKHIAIFYSTEDVLAGTPSLHLQQATTSHKFESEGWRVRKDGSRFWATVSYNPIYDEAGEITGFTKITRDITERKKAEEQLRQFNEELEKQVDEKTTEVKEIFERVTDNFIAFDKEYHYTYVNPKAEEFHGLPAAELIGKKLFEVYPRAKGSRFEQCVLQAMHQQKRMYVEEEDPHSGKWVAVNIFPSVNGFSIFFRDITENRLAKEALKEKEEKFQTLFEEAIDGIMLFSSTLGRFVEVNKKSGELLGYTREELLTMHITDITFPEELREKPLRFPGPVHGDTVIMERSLRRKDGTALYAEVNSRKLVDGNYLTFIRDIRERKSAEEAIHASEKKYRFLFNNNPLPMIMLSLPERDIVDVNEAAINHYGYSRDEFLSLDPRHMGPRKSNGSCSTGAEKNIDPDPGLQKMEKHLKKDGSGITVEIISSDFIYEGKPVRLMLCNDISEKLKAEEGLKRSYEEIRRLASHLQDVREEERSAIAREIHDELGQQLTGLKMDLSWISKRVPTEKDAQAKQKIGAAFHLLDDTIKTVRKLATNLHPSILDDLGLLAAIEWQSQEFEKRTGIRTSFDSSVGELDFPSSMTIGLFRICQESLTNVARYASAKQVRISFYPDQDHLVLKIADDGKGFDLEKVRIKKTLGLLGMRERAMMMGAKLDICSQEGRGTSLLVRIPLSSLYPMDDEH